MDEILKENDILASENNILRKKVLDLQEQLNSEQMAQEEAAKEPEHLNALLQQKTADEGVLEQKFVDLEAQARQLRAENDRQKEEIRERADGQQSSENEIRSLKDQISELEKNLSNSRDQNKDAVRQTGQEKNRTASLF